jgi:5'-3' exonuclease
MEPVTRLDPASVKKFRTKTYQAHPEKSSPKKLSGRHLNRSQPDDFLKKFLRMTIQIEDCANRKTIRQVTDWLLATGPGTST